MVVDLTKEFGKPEQIARDLHIGEEDDVDSEWLSDAVAKGNRQVKNELAAHADVLPFAADSINDDLDEAVNSWVNYLWAIREKDEKGEISQLKVHDRTMVGIITTLKTTPTERSDTFVVTNEYRSDPLRFREKFFNE